MLQVAKQIISQYEPITLEQMGRIKLMNRIDTKFVVSASQLCEILRRATGGYYVQVVGDERASEYRTAYLDTPDRRMYQMHHAGHAVREKIRVRTYVSSDLTFLEIKNKSNRGRTDKRRMKVTSRETLGAEGADGFLHEHAWFGLLDIAYCLENSFRRITLVNKEMTERLTIDFNVSFHNLATDRRAALTDIAIVEVKRDGRVPSPILGILRDLHILPMGFSKYCMGMAMTDPSLRRGRFKPRLRAIARLSQCTMHNT